MGLRLRDMVVLPEDPSRVCDLADSLLREWIPSVDVLSGDEPVPRVEVELGTLPTALRWAYLRFGSTGSRLFHQDPLVHLADLRADSEGVVPFRREQQGCVEWGYVVDGGSDPRVLMKDFSGTGKSPWELHQDRLSIHMFEGVLGEAMFCSDTHAANLEASDAAIVALQSLETLGIPAHPFWAGAGSVKWHGVEGAVVRNDADTWLWALARSADDLGVLIEAVPGDWNVVDA